MRIMLAGTVTVLLMCVSFGSADFKRSKSEVGLSAQRTDSYVLPFRKNERAVAMASGSYRSCMGVYLFDANGNCLAKDDLSEPATGDDLVLDWIPAESGRYCVEVRNAGFESNKYEIALR